MNQTKLTSLLSVQKSYRPVATLSTVSAMAALIDVTGGVGARGVVTSYDQL